MTTQPHTDPVRPLRRLSNPPLPRNRTPPPAASAGVRVLDTPAPDRTSVPTPRQTAESSPAPDPRLWAGQFLQAVLEITTGLRPAAQVTRWVDETVLAKLRRRAAANRPSTVVPIQNGTRTASTPTGRTSTAPRRAPAVLSVHTSLVCAGIVEVAAVVHDGERVRALACRMEAEHGRWRITALEFG